MTEIPEDVMRAAREAMKDATGGAAMCIARAIIAERERCARVADRHVHAHHTAIRDAILNP